MSFEHSEIAVLGAGSWGTALALLLAQDGGVVRLWDRTDTQIAALLAERENQRYLPGHLFPENLHPTADLDAALAGASCVVVAVPSAAVDEVLSRAQLANGADIVLAAKGIDPETLELPSDVTARLAPGHSVVALSGPNLAREVAAGIPAAAVAASGDGMAARRVAERFNRATFRTYVSDDLIGVEVGGAVKNVLAIAGGISDGLGYGDNTKAALMARGLAEMARLGVALGGKQETFYGLAGVGDLIATAASKLSRNWRVGHGLGQGKDLPDILAELGQVAEGVPTARAVARLATKHGLFLPVCSTVAELLEGSLTPREGVARLTENRTAKTE
ncbi:NAD(P)H-dependent glycerol-3-phosphate dehydrogenase [Armatimonas sp.]|uniref:NAD(P)H-dependent glycerol-3-phosphate dehydrogenase n=1 Tax=Armatimonas sp. TaxID=1872638 RepID=UPI00286B0A76|nr:NAD(P)H-dependent glycerol-3-phosphate dehydrogenase [Armatimonas sp.]